MPNTHNLLIRVTCITWCIMKLYSYKIWLHDDRNYPVIPFFNFLDTIPPVVFTVVFYASLLAIALLFIYPRNIATAAVVVVTVVLSCLQDVVSWQPWEYQFLFIICISLYHKNNVQAFYNAFVFTIAAIYIYSGLQKFNGGFLFSIWEGMILRQFFGLSTHAIVNAKLHYIGLILPVVETVTGLGLLLAKKKKTFALFAIATHVFILILLIEINGKFSIVLPWNAAMIFFLLTLFYWNNISFSFPLALHKNKMILLFWGILPALNFIGYWPDKFSFSLYSGDTLRMAICIKDVRAVKQLESYINTNNPYSLCGNNTLLISGWCMDQVNVLPYPEEWYYKKFKDKWQAIHPDVQADFYIYAYPYKHFKKI
jgi:hypothetical protein